MSLFHSVESYTSFFITISKIKLMEHETDFHPEIATESKEFHIGVALSSFKETLN